MILRLMPNSKLYLQSKLIRSAPAITKLRFSYPPLRPRTKLSKLPLFCLSSLQLLLVFRPRPASSTREPLSLFFLPTENNAKKIKSEGLWT